MEGLIVIQDAVISFIEKVKNVRKLYRILAFALAAIILIIVSVVSSGVKLTFNVKSNGEVLANVESASVYEQAMELACKTVGIEELKENQTSLVPVLSVGGKNDSVQKVCSIILDNASDVCYGYSVLLDGECVANIEDITAVQTAVDTRLASFNIKGVECESKFASDLSITPAYFHIDTLSSDEDAVTQINNLDVVTVATKTTILTVSYDTQTRKDTSKNAGYSKVISKGVNGESKRVETVTYLNGKVSSEPEVEEIILKYPINEVIVVGTKNVYVTGTPQNASASGFKWPLAIRGVITSYWGDGRGHKGVDIGVPEGTQVVAVKGGTVVEQGYRSDYGWYVTIDHGNGVKTKYAHNKRNVVSVGQTVSAGQLIALSGNTGRSTGPHLHFEVIINGKRVDPSIYIRI